MPGTWKKETKIDLEKFNRFLSTSQFEALSSSIVISGKI